MHFEDAKLIAIFTVLGFVLFGGGAYAVYDGWPYLVLERGFTQVIIGSIACSAGLILLSLAWVLRELRGLKQSLAEAVQMRAEPTAQAALERARALRDRVHPDAADLPSLGPAALGTAAGAVAVGAAASALATPAGEADQPPASAGSAAMERDLFGTLVAKERDEPQPEPDASGDETTTPPEPVEPLPDMFEVSSFARPGEDEDAPVAIETESYEPAEIVSAKIQPVGEDEALAHAAEPSAVAPAAAEPAASFEQAPEAPATPAKEPKPADDPFDLDEFSALRESLAGHLNEPLGGSRIEPSLSSDADPFADAEAWMDRASPRQEPSFDRPAETEPKPAVTAAPPWPPRTEAPDFAEPAEQASEELESDSEPESAEDRPEESPSAAAEEPAETAPPEEPAAEETQGAPERAASDEGIVGAYQVGDAHFTIYADGSIRARTPDGEFSFASMDELKAYLASEKNRLGV